MVFAVNERLFDDERKPRFGREYDLDEFCGKCGITVKTYKAWEKRGFLPKVKTNPVTGYRVFTDNDIVRVREFVKKMKKNPKSRLGINKKGTDKRREWPEDEICGKPTLGGLIRKHRLGNGLTANELGNLLGVTESTVLNWEKSRTHPCRAHLLRLKKHLRIDPFEIIEFAGTISERERAILQLVREKGSVTSLDCQTALDLRQRDAQNGLLSLYRLEVLDRILGERRKATYFIKGEYNEQR